MTDDSKKITRDFIHNEVGRARTYFLVLLYLGDHERDNKEELDQLQFEHLTHMFRLREQGKLVLNGPLLKDDKLRGICIYNCETIEEVETHSAADPMVKAGYLKAEISPWLGLPGDTLPG
jgi:uncharacterized protein YciI